MGSAMSILSSPFEFPLRKRASAERGAESHRDTKTARRRGECVMLETPLSTIPSDPAQGAYSIRLGRTGQILARDRHAVDIFVDPARQAALAWVRGFSWFAGSRRKKRGGVEAASGSRGCSHRDRSHPFIPGDTSPFLVQ